MGDGPMPRYYFALFRPGLFRPSLFRPPADEEGHDFANDRAARAEAIRCARDLARNREPHMQERVIVTRQNGTVVHEVFLKAPIPDRGRQIT